MCLILILIVLVKNVTEELWTEYRHWQVAQSQWHAYGNDDSTDSSECEDPSGDDGSSTTSSNIDSDSTNPDGGICGTDDGGGDTSNDHGGDSGDSNSDNSHDAVIKAMIIT